MVVGARSGRVYRGSAIKWPMRILLRFLVEWTTGRKIPDINSGLRIFSKKTAIGYFQRLSNTFSFTTSITLAYMMDSRFVSYLSIPYHDRIGTTHVRLWRDSLRTFQFVLQILTFYNPLKIFLLLSIIVLISGIIFTFLGLFLSLTTLIFLGIFFIFGSVLIFSLGLLADLLRQNFIAFRNSLESE